MLLSLRKKNKNKKNKKPNKQTNKQSIKQTNNNKTHKKQQQHIVAPVYITDGDAIIQLL